MKKSFTIIVSLIWGLFLLELVFILPGSYAQRTENFSSYIADGDEALRSRLYSEALRLYEAAHEDLPIPNNDQSL